MARAEAAAAPQTSVSARVKAYANANLLHMFAATLFLLLAVFLLCPIFLVLIKSIKGSGGYTLSHYTKFFVKGYYFRSLKNTLWLGAINTIVCLVAGFCLAYLTARGPLGLRKPMKMVAMLPLIAPPYLFAISLIILFGNNGILTKALNIKGSLYGFWGVVVAQSLAFFPLAYLMIENTLMSLNPNLEESAYDMGASEVRIIRTITIPLLAPAILKAGLLVFVMTIAEFGNAAILGGRTPLLAPDTYQMIIGEADFEMGSVLSIVLITPCVIVFFLHNYLLTGKQFTTIGGKPVASEPRKMTPLVRIPFMLISLLTVSAVLISFGVVLFASFTKIFGVNNEIVFAHLLNFDSNLAIYNSIKMSFTAAFIAATIGTLLAYVTVRGKFFGRTAIEMISLSGFALPGTVIGIGYLLAFNAPPLKLTGGIMILVLNCVFRFLAVGVEAGISKLHQINIEIEEASLDLGANFIHTFCRVVLPIMFPAFIAGFVYTFMTSIVSLSSVVFLVSPGFELAAVKIFDAAVYGEIGLASATTIKLVVIVMASMLMLNFLSKSNRFASTQKGAAG